MPGTPLFFQGFHPESPECVFWDVNENRQLGSWSGDGCKYEGKLEEFLVCNCTHLSTFAVLFVSSETFSCTFLNKIYIWRAFRAALQKKYALFTLLYSSFLDNLTSREEQGKMKWMGHGASSTSFVLVPLALTYTKKDQLAKKPLL
ncbi:hypothetical protein HPB48_012160 [Haemaphysalis longicornis]|uniref:GAIN-B domain-containing protein n=1 Tax=Haemaphysalis longicornis TaxID=44386 RepID=A0A9J6GBU6_HAELO|nr:hypothetical protein HPB48_012160 [Haemaphysalis longicornis]